MSATQVFKMDDDNVDTCSICMDPYDSSVRPRSLPCGHSFCTSCINNSIDDGRLLCPQCKQPHSASSVNDFPVNYDMEAVISVLRKSKLGTIPKANLGSSFRSSQPGSKWKAVFDDEKESLRKLTEVCEEMISEMHDYQVFLDQRTVEYEEFIPRIREWLQSNEDALRQIGEEKKHLSDAVKEANELKKRATDTLRRFDAVTNIKDIISGSEDVGRTYEVLEEWRIRTQIHLPNAKLISSSEKIVRETTSALCLLNTEDVGKITEKDLTSLPILRKLDILRGKDKISIGDLQNMSTHLRSQLENELVFAVQKKEGLSRYAKLSMRNAKIYLHNLQDTKPPKCTVTVKHEELINALKTDSIVSFMDLSWEGSVRGRVHILLSPDTPLARHFKVLCSGELGPSYAKSRFLEVSGKGSSNENIYGGDYERGNGTGGAALITGLIPGDKIYNRSCNEGIVWERFGVNDGPQIAQFGINTRCLPKRKYSQVFGQVQDGLEIVKSAVNLDDIKKVLVEDCGLVVNV